MGNDEFYVKLTEAQKQLIPYKLGQTVSFTDSMGIIFYASVIEDTTFWSFEIQDHEPPFYKVHTQHRVVRLTSDTNNFKLDLSIIAGSFYIGVFYSENFIFLININKKGEFYNQDPNGLYCFYYHKSMEINNKIYYDVEEQVITSYYEENGIWSLVNTKLLYNKNYGILQLEYKDKVLFMINN